MRVFSQGLIGIANEVSHILNVGLWYLVVDSVFRYTMHKASETFVTFVMYGLFNVYYKIQALFDSLTFLKFIDSFGVENPKSLLYGKVFASSFLCANS